MAKIVVRNIVRETYGGQDYKGVQQVEFDVNQGTYVPNSNEGELHPTGADNVGTPDGFPVRLNVQHEDLATVLSRLTAADGAYKVVGQVPNGGGNNEVFDVANAAWQQAQVSFDRQSGQAQLQGIGFSADGSAMPFGRNSALDSTAPTGTKTYGRGIAGLTYNSATVPGILSGQFTVRRGEFQPDFGDNINKIYPTGYHILGTPQGQFPLTGSLQLEDSQAVDLLGGSAADLVITLLAGGGGTNPVITLKNVTFQGTRTQLQRRALGGFPLEFFAFSDAASPGTLPITVA